MDEAAQQNAALVEEAAAAAEAMREQTGKLAQVVSQFKLDGMKLSSVATMPAHSRPVIVPLVRKVSPARVAANNGLQMKRLVNATRSGGWDAF